MGRTIGPSVVMFDLRASPAIAMRSFDREKPTFPASSSSSSWNTQLNARSSAPMWVRRVWTCWFFARRRSDQRFDRRMAAPPLRKRQFVTMDGLLPVYQFRIMFSVLTTKA
ncbi:hypothetical protein AAC387_Pa06g1346 [Persea americana]